MKGSGVLVAAAVVTLLVVGAWWILCNREKFVPGIDKPNYKHMLATRVQDCVAGGNLAECVNINTTQYGGSKSENKKYMNKCIGVAKTMLNKNAPPNAAQFMCAAQALGGSLTRL